MTLYAHRESSPPLHFWELINLVIFKTFKNFLKVVKFLNLHWVDTFENCHSYMKVPYMRASVYVCIYERERRKEIKFQHSTIYRGH